MTPLCIDLDHTLARTDLLHECAVRVLVRTPLTFLRALSALGHGRAAFKFTLAEAADLDVEHLPWHGEVVALGRAAKASGRDVYLVTACAPQLAARVAQVHPWIGEVISSDRTTNLKGVTKARRLTERFGPGGFDYVGDARADEPVFAAAREAYLVTGSSARAKAFERRPRAHAVRVAGSGLFRACLREARPHQWLKNGLIGVPLVLSHLYGDAAAWAHTVWAFLSFSLCASSVYVLNDLVDVQSDRAHDTKRNRPIAAGELSLPLAMLLGVVLLGAAFAIAGRMLELDFVEVLGAYFGLTTIYSFWLKRELVVDVVCLALLYTVRIVAGTAATGAMTSHWLLAFSIFIFTSLAMVKRAGELRRLVLKGRTTALGRAYVTDDLDIIEAIGVGAGLVSVLICVLYLDSEMARRLYGRPQYLMVVVPVLLFWISRTWILAARGQLTEDPVVWAMKDRVSHLVLGLIALALYLAL